VDAAGRKTGRRTPEGLKYSIEYIDHLVGRIVAALDCLGLRENTVLLFTGDNASMRFGKATATELGCLVPMICNGPGWVKPQSKSDALVDLSDILPTLADLAGVPLPQDEQFDGRSFAPVLRGEKSDVRDWAFSYLADKRLLRDKRWFHDADGRFFDCGDNRSGQGYTDVTDSKVPEVVAAEKRFEAILKSLPGPDPEADASIIERYREQWERQFTEKIKDYNERWKDK